MPGSVDDFRRPRVAAVVTSFGPDERLVEVCRAVLAQVDTCVVVDDGTPVPPTELLQACRDLGAQVHVHEANLGIGAALNTGLRLVLEAAEPAAMVLTLDQDSAVSDGYVDALVDAYARASAAGVPVGMVGPETVESIGSMASRRRGGVLFGREPIQSGLLVPTAVLERLGGFADELFIDGVDSELYLHARAEGFTVVVAPGTRLGHRLGKAHALAGTGADGSARGPQLVHAAPFRYYYIARNRITLVRRYVRSAPGWCVRAVAKDVRHQLIAGVLIPGRRERWAQTALGLRDGLRGVTGPRPARP